jgi:hypothetical protein
MPFNQNKGRSLALAVAVLSGVALAPAAAHAGFLDQLFGGGAPVPEQPQIQPQGGGYSYDQMDQGYQPIPRKPRMKKKVAVADKPVLQKTTDIMSDSTLRPGDAVMMKSGVHIFNGESDSHHDADEFVALDSARHVAKDTKGQLAALDVAHRAPLQYAERTTTMLEGRSVAGREISEGYKITDARGRSIRYVGP